MPGRRNPKRFLLKRLDQAPATGFELTSESGHPDRVLPALWSLEASGHVTRSTTDHHYRLTTKGTDTLMRISRKKGAASASTPTDINAERDRLAQEFHGPHYAAMAAVVDDEMLHERLNIAIGNGMSPIDLREVPKYKRAEVVDEALTGWHKAVAGGPCGFCGTRERRSSGMPVSVIDQPEIPGFTPRADGTSACAWCQNALVTWTADQLRDLVFNAIVGVKGVPIIGVFRSHPTMTPFASEVGYSGTAWGHLTGDSLDAQVFRAAMRMRAVEVVHPKRFCRFEGEASISGITSPAWAAEELPSGKLKPFAPLGDLVTAAEEEQALRARREKAEYDKEHKYDAINRNRAMAEAREAQNEQNFRDHAKSLGVL